MSTVLETLEAAFLARKTENEKKLPVRNQDLPAGAPMYYYCRMCSYEFIVAENDFRPVPRLCIPCKDLQAARETVAKAKVLMRQA